MDVNRALHCPHGGARPRRVCGPRRHGNHPEATGLRRAGRGVPLRTRRARSRPSRRDRSPPRRPRSPGGQGLECPRTFLWTSSAGWKVREVGAQAGGDLSGDVAPEAAHDVLLGLALGGAARGIPAGSGAVAQAADGDHVQSAVDLSVAAGIVGRRGRRLPEETGIGLTPQRAANAATPPRRSMFWPAVTSSCPACPLEMPTSAVVRGAAVSGPRNPGRLSHPRGRLAAAVTAMRTGRRARRPGSAGRLPPASSPGREISSTRHMTRHGRSRAGRGPRCAVRRVRLLGCSAWLPAGGRRSAW